MCRCRGHRHHATISVVGKTMSDGRCQAFNLSKIWVALCLTVTTSAVVKKLDPVHLVY
jgi:hypothetical protein